MRLINDQDTTSTLEIPRIMDVDDNAGKDPSKDCNGTATSNHHGNEDREVEGLTYEGTVSRTRSRNRLRNLDSNTEGVIKRTRAGNPLLVLKTADNELGTTVLPSYIANEHGRPRVVLASGNVSGSIVRTEADDAIPGHFNGMEDAMVLIRECAHDIYKGMMAFNREQEHGSAHGEHKPATEEMDKQRFNKLVYLLNDEKAWPRQRYAKLALDIFGRKPNQQEFETMASVMLAPPRAVLEAFVDESDKEKVGESKKIVRRLLDQHPRHCGTERMKRGLVPLLTTILCSFGRCPYCGRTLNKYTPWEERTAQETGYFDIVSTGDHMNPRHSATHGVPDGLTSPDNIVICCHSCNIAKDNVALDAWINMLGNQNRAHTIAVLSLVKSAGLGRPVAVTSSNLADTEAKAITLLQLANPHIDMNAIYKIVKKEHDRARGQKWTEIHTAIRKKNRAAHKTGRRSTEEE